MELIGYAKLTVRDCFTGVRGIQILYFSSFCGWHL